MNFKFYLIRNAWPNTKQFFALMGDIFAFESEHLLVGRRCSCSCRQRNTDEIVLFVVQSAPTNHKTPPDTIQSLLNALGANVLPPNTLIGFHVDI